MEPTVPGDSGMEEGERGVWRGAIFAPGVKSRDTLMGSESARRNGVLVTDLDTWIGARLGVSMDWRQTQHDKMVTILYTIVHVHVHVAVYTCMQMYMYMYTHSDGVHVNVIESRFLDTALQF